MEAALYINHPSGFLACSPQNQQFRVAGVIGFISYRRQGKHRIAFGGVHSDTPQADSLLAAFLDETRRASERALFVQVPAHQVALFEARGATVNRLGSSFVLPLAGYSLRGTAKISLRNKIHRAQRAGLRVVELGKDMPADESLIDQVREISEDWLRDKGKKELAFMVGVTSDALDAYRRTFVALDAAQKLAGFVTYVPAWGDHAGVLHDLSRRRPDAPPGVMELINSFAIERFQQEDIPHLHFGFTPFVLTGDEPASASGIMSRLSEFLYRHGSFVYPARSQADYKRKWGADTLLPEYVAGYPLSLPAVFALLRLTRAL